MLQAKPDPPESDHPFDDLLDAGLSAAFGSDSVKSEINGLLDVDGPGLLRSLSSLSYSRPRIELPDSKTEEDPVLKSHDIHWNQPCSTGRYELLGEIGQGAMGSVFWARDTELGRELAVKVLRDKCRNMPGALERFVEEAEIVGHLQHPGIVPIYELGEFDDGRPYITMKLVKGKTLAQLLQERPQDRQRILGIFEQVCQAVAYAHSRGVIHRNLKPGNVMVGSFGEVQVMDWGLAKVLSQPGDANDRQRHSIQSGANESSPLGTATDDTSGSTPLATEDGTVLGTPAYISPEQAGGEIEQTDERTDVFGLGAMLCEILTGEPPYIGDHVRHKAKNAELAGTLHRLANCGADEELISLVSTCLAPDPEDRPRHAGILAEEFGDYLASVEDRLRQVELENVQVRSRAKHDRKMRKMTLALAATVLVSGVLAATGWFWLQRHEQNRVIETNRWLRRELKEEKENTALEFLNLFSDKALPSNQVLTNIERMLSTLFTTSPIDEATLRQTVSSFYVSVGEYELAWVHAEKAVKMLREHAGQERPITLAAQDYAKRVRALCFPDPAPRGEIVSATKSSPDDILVFSSSYANEVLTDSPVGYWRLNEPAGEQAVHDASPHANHFFLSRHFSRTRCN